MLFADRACVTAMDFKKAVIVVVVAVNVFMLYIKRKGFPTFTLRNRTLSIERNPFPAKNEPDTVRLDIVYISPTRSALRSA